MTIDAVAFRRMIRPVGRVLRDDFVRHSALVFAASMAGNVLNYLFNFALSRRLGVEGYATLSSLVSLFMILSIPTTVLTLVVVKYAAVFHAADDPKRIRRLSQILLRWTGIAALAAFAIGVALRGPIAGFLRIPNDLAVPLCVALLCVGLITPSVRGILQGEQDFFRYSISSVLEASLKVGFAVTLVYAGFGVVGAMAGWLAATCCALAYTVWAVMKKHGTAAESTVRLSLDVRRLVNTVFGVGLATSFLTVMSFVDVLLVKHFFEPRQAGLYAAVNLTGKIVLFLAGFVPAVMLPKAIARSSRGEELLPLLAQATALTIVMSGAALAVFGSMSVQVLAVVAGRAFVAGAPYVLQYDAAMCALAVVTLLVNYKIGIHRFDFLYPLGLVVAGEIAAICAFHSSIWDVVHILLAGNIVASAALCIGLKASSQSRALQTPEAA